MNPVEKLKEIIKEPISDEMREILELELKRLMLMKHRKELQEKLQKECIHIGAMEYDMIQKIVRKYNRLSPHGRKIVKLKISIGELDEKEIDVKEEQIKKLQAIAKTDKYYEYAKYKEILMKALSVEQ